MEMSKNMLRFAEVSVHNMAEDCWVIINAKAYNVTNFLSHHPGGEEVLLAVAGKDASEEFENAGHGSAARLMLDEFYVGEVDQLTLPKRIINLPAKITQEKDVEPSSRVSKFILFAVSLTILVFSIGMKIFSSNLAQ